MVTTEQRRIYKARYKARNPEKFKEDKLRYKKRYPEKFRKWAITSHKKFRMDALTIYSNGSLVCAKCGESIIEFLEIDHINGGGKKHKQKINGNLFSWLKKNNYPAGYQVLCSNCNIKKVRDSARLNVINGTLSQKKTFRKSLNLKHTVFSHYMTDGKIKCVCCGIEDIDLLCMDHINGGGEIHRRSGEIGTKGQTIYKWLKKNNYPKDFRILCHNCNQSIGNRGYCPHNKDKSLLKFL